MSRPPQISKSQISELARTLDSVNEIARALQCTPQTVYRLAKSHKIKLPKSSEVDESIREALVMFRAYKGLLSLQDLSVQFKKPVNTLRYNLSKAILHYWRNDKPKLPAPTMLSQIKVVNELERDMSLYDDPERIRELTGLRLGVIRKYIDQIYLHLQEK